MPEWRTHWASCAPQSWLWNAASPSDPLDLRLFVPAPTAGAPGPGSPRTGLRPWGGDPDSGTWESMSPKVRNPAPRDSPISLSFIIDKEAAVSTLRSQPERTNSPDS